MLISEKFVFVPFLTGPADHLTPLVAKATRATSTKTPRHAADLAAQGKPVIALVCDPRSWYIHLWRHGCEKKGELHKRLTDPKVWAARRERLGAGDNDLPLHWDAAFAETHWYGDAENVGAFREWLVALLEVRSMRYMISQAYHRSALSRGCGFMSYVYSELFVHNPNELGALPASAMALKAIDAQHGILAHVVRSEVPAKELLTALDAVGTEMSEQERALLAREPGRRVQIRREWDKFVDDELMKKLYQREKFIFGRFGYRQRVSEEQRKAAEAAAVAREEAAKKRRQAAAAERRKAAKEAEEAGKSTRPKLDDFDFDEE